MKKDYDFIVGFTLFYPNGFKTRFRHFDNLRVAELFCENKNLKNNSKIYVDYDYFKEIRKETIAECYYNCSEFWQNKIKAKIEPKLKELKEQINEEWKKYGNSKELQDMEDMRNFLQSLLEKE